MRKWTAGGVGTFAARQGLPLDEPQAASFVQKAASFAEKVFSAVNPLDLESRKVVVDEMIAAMVAGGEPADRIELLAQLHGLLAEKTGDQEMAALGLDDALTACGLMPVVEEIERRAKDVVLPEPTTAGNVETLMMGYGYWLTGVFDNCTTEQTACALKAALWRSPIVERCRKKQEVFSQRPDREALLLFSEEWVRAAFARLEVGHKLAASLCLTDIPDDVEVRAPWPAWSLVVPDGLLGALARVWCRGTEPVFMVTRGGNIHERADESEDHVSTVMLRALVRGACLALSNPDDFRKEKQHAPTARAQSKSHRHGPPDFQQARFLLSAPVKVDLRAHIASALSGQSHASPTMQFLVRGHWRNQAHGPKHSLRKTIWVQPFWKGDPDTLILLRQHRVEEPPKDEDPPESP